MSLTNQTGYEWTYYFTGAALKGYSDTILLYYIRNLKTIKEALRRKYGVTKIGIFGSYARGEATTKSDLNIIVDFPMKSFDQLFDIEELVKRTINFENVDLDSTSYLSAFKMEEISKEVIYI